MPPVSPLGSRPAISISNPRALLHLSSPSTISRGSSVQSSEISLRRAMSSSARAFQLQLNPLTGDSEWIVVDEGSADQDGDGDAGPDPNPRSLLATTSYLDMLNDSRRNRAFRLAIEKTLTRPCRVLDIGAGTGLLSMMAAQAMGGRGEVWACESYLPMAKLMRRVLRQNGMEGKVKLFCKRSDELRVGDELPSHADVLVSEILDSELLGEGLIPTLQHAHDSLLVENPKTVPYQATIYGQLVESTSLWKLHDLNNREVEVSDGICLTPAGLERIISIKPQQYAMHCDALSGEIRLLSKPFKLFEFDFWKRPDGQGENKLKITAAKDGSVHAVISWWVLQLDYEGSVLYSTAPKWTRSLGIEKEPTQSPGADWCEHWRQCVWFIPGSGIPVTKDEQVLFQAVHNEIRISYCIKVDGQDGTPGMESQDVHLMLSPERIAVYGDKDWRLSFLTAVKNALQTRSSPLCVVADDSVFLAVLAASLSECSKVICLFPGIRDKGVQYLEAVASANGFSMDRIEVMGKRTSCLSLNDFNQRKVDMLLGEPFFYGYEGVLPWQNLRFWRERTTMGSMLAEDAIIMPCRGILKACAMSIPDLWKSRCCLENIEGFDHSTVNETLGACGNLLSLQEGSCLPYFIWQCGEVEELSEVFSIMNFNFAEPIHACFGKRKIEFSKVGLCHGFALWIDWVIDDRNSIVISTGPDSRYWRQGVKLLSKPVSVNVDACSAEIEAQFDPTTGELIVKSSFISC